MERERLDQHFSEPETPAARRALRLRDGLAAVAEWEAEHGALNGEELEAARRRVGQAGQKGRWA